MRKSFKSSNFLKVIDKYAKKQKTKLTDEIREMEERELKKAESEIMEDVNSMIQKETINMKNKIIVEISHRELEERKKISRRRQEIMKEIFEECRKRLINFTTSQMYVQTLKDYSSEISKVLNESDVQLFVKSSDEKYAQLIKDAFGRDCTVSIADDILIGGVRGYSKSYGIVADETLDAKLGEQEDWVATHFGVLLV